LTNLEVLYLHYNQISDISPLSSLTNLNKISLARNPISDVHPFVQSSTPPPAPSPAPPPKPTEWIEIGTQYGTAKHPAGIDGKLAYVVMEGDKRSTWYSVVYNDEKGPKYDWIEKVIGVAGKPAYLVRQTGKWLIIYKGQEMGWDYNSVSEPADVGGKLAFTAKKDGKSFIVMEK
jgi:hypothetical protein